VRSSSAVSFSIVIVFILKGLQNTCRLKNAIKSSHALFGAAVGVVDGDFWELRPLEVVALRRL